MVHLDIDHATIPTLPYLIPFVGCHPALDSNHEFVDQFKELPTPAGLILSTPY